MRACTTEQSSSPGPSKECLALPSPYKDTLCLHKKVSPVILGSGCPKCPFSSNDEWLVFFPPSFPSGCLWVACFFLWVSTFSYLYTTVCLYCPVATDTPCMSSLLSRYGCENFDCFTLGALPHQNRTREALNSMAFCLLEHSLQFLSLPLPQSETFPSGSFSLDTIPLPLISSLGLKTKQKKTKSGLVSSYRANFCLNC